MSEGREKEGSEKETDAAKLSSSCTATAKPHSTRHVPAFHSRASSRSLSKLSSKPVGITNSTYINIISCFPTIST